MIKIMFLEYPLTIEDYGYIVDVPKEIELLVRRVGPYCGAQPQCDMQYFNELKEKYPHYVTMISHEPYEEPPYNPNVIY